MFLPFRRHSIRLSMAACVAAAVLACPRAAFALESAWVEASHSRVRLVADSAGEGPRAGVEIMLEKDWKTYWRYPGDSGVPPHFDWTGSENLAAAKVRWPAPRLFKDESGMKSIGYHGRVVFPIAIEPADPGLPVKLRLKMDFAVCEKLCVPAGAEMTLEIPAESGALSEILEQAASAVPRRIMLGQGGELSVENIRIEHGGKPRAIITVKAPADAAPVLFAEGPNEHWALPVPEKIGSADGSTRFSLVFDGAPPGAKPIPPKMILTLTTGDDAVEVEIPLE